MNAARPIFSSGFTSASLTPTPAVPTSALAPREGNSARASVTSKARAAARARRLKRSAKITAPEAAPCDEYSSCLVQARICRDQAQEAARLKRFQSAVGLFQTAISLCQRAVSLRKTPASTIATAANAGEAHEYLQVLASEMSAYDELARSMNRPLVEGGR